MKPFVLILILILILSKDRRMNGRSQTCRYEKAPESFNSGACRLVRLAGIEPTTPWFVAKYSIQLSYSR